MIHKLLSLLGKNSPKKDDFSEFFRHASKEQQKKVYDEALRKANLEQGRLYKRATQE
jgi:hypothetical protein